TGSTGGSDLTDQVDAITTQLDNGAPCATGIPGVGSAVVDALDELYFLYATASGTASSPATGNYKGKNLIDSADIPTYQPIFFPAIPSPLNFTVTKYKALYSTQIALGAFDLTKATPRVDQAFSAFATQFENIWLWAPSASPSGDNQVN